MDTIFMNSTNSKTPKANRLTLKLQSKMDLSVRKSLSHWQIYPYITAGKTYLQN